MEITARGLVFEVSAAGPEDGEPVLLLHGFPQNSHEWDAVLPALHEAGLRTFTLDQRGYSPGARPAERTDYRITECAADAVAVGAALGYDSMHVVGHDWGAIAAWQTALRHSSFVRTLTAISVPHPLAMAEALTTQEQQQRSAYVQLFRQEGKAEEVLLADDAQRLRAMFADAMDDETRDRYVRPMLEPGALTAALNWYRAISRRDNEDLGSATVPTTYIWSDGDVAIGALAAELCEKHVAADYKFVVLNGITHWIPDQVPDAVAAEIRARTNR
jgi:pimeloyl-ACP methyl ester carboxylesterase